MVDFEFLELSSLEVIDGKHMNNIIKNVYAIKDARSKMGYLVISGKM